ncbi:hypothetical protein [Microvirga alba]|uniref:DUF2147 domain-containing protein n=1 Tax=Microvirga alba TaxID=2791025 RepID=A0A931FQ65_9HYPH|nr:hypothetical protein [Microvirga alba]MBF9234262.1 hypothetical protein [Microvirga alba]
MSRRSWKFLVAYGFFAAFLGAQPVLADSIDGHWCSSDGRHLSIQGPAIVTPAGTRVEGSYTRHSFLYSVPESEPDRGQEVSLRLLSEVQVEIRFGRADRQSETWRRCAATTS